MRLWTYDESDEMHARLGGAQRRDLERYVPRAGGTLPEAQIEFWTDVAACFARGDWQDAVTAVERRFEPRRTKAGDADAIAAAQQGRVAA